MSESRDKRDLRSVLKQLEQRGKVYRFREPSNKDTELLPVYRVQQRGLQDSERKVLLFENIVGAKRKIYDMSVVAGIYGASEEILALGIGCESPSEILEKWHQGMAHPLPPVLVQDGPVHDEVHTGDEIKELGLDELPIPVEEPGFSGVLRTGLPMITKDPETGVRNVGTYNGFARAGSHGGRDQHDTRRRLLSLAERTAARRRIARRDRDRRRAGDHAGRIGRHPLRHG
jgi:UbiD family decarboxylase